MLLYRYSVTTVALFFFFFCCWQLDLALATDHGRLPLAGETLLSGLKCWVRGYDETGECRRLCHYYHAYFWPKWTHSFSQIVSTPFKHGILPRHCTLTQTLYIYPHVDMTHLFIRVKREHRLFFVVVFCCCCCCFVVVLLLLFFRY